MMEKLPHVIGDALKNVKAGLEETIYFDRGLASVPEHIRLTSSAFTHLQPLPARFTQDGEKISPPLAWTGVPEGTQTLVLLMEDADSPTPNPLTHAIVLDLPPRDGSLAEGALSSPAREGEPHAMGKNSFFQAQYLPPDPPPGHGPHRYLFQLYALNQPLPELSNPSKATVREAFPGKVIAKGSMIGTYERP